MIRILSRREVSLKLDDCKFAINFSAEPLRVTYLSKLLHSNVVISLDPMSFQNISQRIFCAIMFHERLACSDD